VEGFHLKNVGGVALIAIPTARTNFAPDDFRLRFTLDQQNLQER
jgi:hypothetical protein